MAVDDQPDIEPGDLWTELRAKAAEMDTLVESLKPDPSGTFVLDPEEVERYQQLMAATHTIKRKIASCAHVYESEEHEVWAWNTGFAIRREVSWRCKRCGHVPRPGGDARPVSPAH